MLNIVHKTNILMYPSRPTFLCTRRTVGTLKPPTVHKEGHVRMCRVPNTKLCEYEVVVCKSKPVVTNPCMDAFIPPLTTLLKWHHRLQSTRSSNASMEKPSGTTWKVLQHKNFSHTGKWRSLWKKKLFSCHRQEVNPTPYRKKLILNNWNVSVS